LERKKHQNTQEDNGMNLLSFIFAGKPSAKQQRENLEEEIKLAKLQRKAKLMEAGGQDFWMSNYSDLLGRYSDGYLNQYPMTQPADRRYGSNFPFWVNETQLSMLRAQARFVVTTSPNAQGLLNGICSYVIGCGYSYRAVSKKDLDVPENIIKAVQVVINTFTEQNAWNEMEQEIFWRTREDGEAFIRLFPQPDGTLSIRTVEPEQVYQPPGSNIHEWSYGIQTEIDDVFLVKAYHVDYQAPGGQSVLEPIEGEIVDADNMVHIKINVKRSIKRGLSDFAFETLDCFQQAGKLRKNMGEGAAVQAAIAAVRQHDTASAGQVQEFIDSTLDYSTTAFGSGKQQDFQKLEAGSFLDIPKGMNYVAPPAAMNSSSHMDIMQGLLRSAGNRHNAPEWLVSSDASNNNFSSSLTAEAPFTRHCVRMQEVYKTHFTRIIKAAIKTAIGAGLLPKDTLNTIDIDVKAPNVETHDKSIEAGNNSIYSSLGIKSKQTIAQEIGLDWEKEERNMAELAGKGIGMPLTLPDMGMGQAPPPPPPESPTAI
jgi:hypothetical protein